MSASKDSRRCARRIHENWAQEGAAWDREAKLGVAVSLLEVRKKANPRELAEAVWDLWHVGPLLEASDAERIEAAAQLIEGWATTPA